MSLHGVAARLVRPVIGRLRMLVCGRANVLAASVRIVPAGRKSLMVLSKHKIILSFSFERREGNPLPAALWIHIEDAVREAVEGSAFELVASSTGPRGFKRGKDITQWP